MSMRDRYPRGLLERQHIYLLRRQHKEHHAAEGKNEQKTNVHSNLPLVRVQTRLQARHPLNLAHIRIEPIPIRR